MIPELDTYIESQCLAEETMKFIQTKIESGMSEEKITVLSENYMRQIEGIEFWYYGVGALVQVGKNTSISVSGKSYTPSSLEVRDSDIITIDLGPTIDGCWGDYARTQIISDGKCVERESLQNPQGLLKEFSDGIDTEQVLHNKLREIDTPRLTFEELYHLMNDEITRLGYENIDFKNNLGHTIEKDKDARRYIKSGCKITISDAGLFTFEPHIRIPGSEYGFKHENIYLFNEGKVKDLLDT